MAIKQFVLASTAPDVDSAKRKLMADCQRAITMVQPAVNKGDGMARTYHAALLSVKLRAADCTKMSQVTELQNELVTVQKSRRKWLSTPMDNSPVLSTVEKVSVERYLDMLVDSFKNGYMGRTKQSALNVCFNVLEGYARSEQKEAPENLRNLKTARVKITEMLRSGELK
jgi:hypothetical protein